MSSYTTTNFKPIDDLPINYHQFKPTLPYSEILVQFQKLLNLEDFPSISKPDDMALSSIPTIATTSLMSTISANALVSTVATTKLSVGRGKCLGNDKLIVKPKNKRKPVTTLSLKVGACEFCQEKRVNFASDRSFCMHISWCYRRAESNPLVNKTNDLNNSNRVTSYVKNESDIVDVELNSDKDVDLRQDIESNVVISDDASSKPVQSTSPHFQLINAIFGEDDDDVVDNQVSTKIEDSSLSDESDRKKIKLDTSQGNDVNTVSCEKDLKYAMSDDMIIEPLPNFIDVVTVNDTKLSDNISGSLQINFNVIDDYSQINNCIVLFALDTGEKVSVGTPTITSTLAVSAANITSQIDQSKASDFSTISNNSSHANLNNVSSSTVMTSISSDNNSSVAHDPPPFKDCSIIVVDKYSTGMRYLQCEVCKTADATLQWCFSCPCAYHPACHDKFDEISANIEKALPSSQNAANPKSDSGNTDLTTNSLEENRRFYCYKCM